jgi:endonuclease-3
MPGTSRKSGDAAPDLRAIVERLEAAHGRPEPPVAREPFAAVIWENVGYLVDDERRGRVFERLRAAVGITPEALLAVPAGELAALIADGGMLPDHRAEKVQRAAAIAAEIGVEELRRQAAAGTGGRLLRRFPGIGEPGADRLLLLAGGKRTLAPDSNALRVLVRLGFGVAGDSYAAQYRAAAAAPQLPEDGAWLLRAHQLLRRHGQEVCKRGAPHCEICPLTRVCDWYAGRARAERNQRPE